VTTATLDPPKAPAEAASQPEAFLPPQVETLAQTKVPEAMLKALIYKLLLSRGDMTGRACAGEVCMPPKPVVEMLTEMKGRQHVVYAGTTSTSDFSYRLTDDGREQAKRYMQESMYVGPAPVRLEDYIASVHAQTITAEKPGRAQLDEAFSDLLIEEEMFARLGPAINSGKGMLLYGFPGNGKTSIAERITKCFGTTIWIPHAIFVEGAIIKLYDPEVHEAVGRRPGLAGMQQDQRWLEINRPTIVVGGELTLDALELSYNRTSKITTASLQLRSNGGTLVIDDFGRQRVSPDELLNRWIVPLEKRQDYLTLSNGKKIKVPFDQLIIFSTNLEPKDLIDDAFLRRIPYKICVSDPTEVAYRCLVEIMGEKLGIPHDESAVDYLLEKWYARTERPLRACQPRDLLLQIVNHASYLGENPVMTKEMFDQACDCYFSAVG
jgi:predicted ATPase with chaperone activity